MSETRVIKVESCGMCGCWCLRNLEYYCLKTNKELPDYPGSPPDSCPLPKWPSVDKKSLGEWTNVFTDILTKTRARRDLIEMLKSIGVEVTDA